MRDLSGVTLACVDTANHALALRALSLSMRSLRFAEVMLLTDAIPATLDVPTGIDVRPIAPIASREAYSRFVLKSLLHHVPTEHVLLIQWDGYVVNPEAFDPAFLECDDIGAKWFWFKDGMRVGNGGFSLRSRRLLEALQDPRIDLVEAEDITIGRAFRPLLEREHGIRYADDALADRFAFEAAYPVGIPFGFHGLYNFCRVVAPDELARLAPVFSDTVVRSVQLGQLLRNCVALGQWSAVTAIATRRLAALPDDHEARALLKRAETERAQGAVVGRNDPCPCGSGKRYKQCHGALGAAAPPSGARAAQTADATTRSFPKPSAAAVAEQGVAEHRAGNIAAAERAYREALRIDPDQTLALHYLGVVLFQRMRYTEALPLIERSAKAMPEEPEFHNNLGLVLAALDRNEDAAPAYQRTLALAPRHATAWNNLGLTLHAMTRVSEAIEAYRRSLALAPEFAQAHWNLALALLAAGEYEEGWREYEWRLKLSELGARTAPLPLPRWQGEDLRGKTLLLDAEQGIGDAVQFIRFAKRVADRGARVVVRASAPLCPLLASAPGVSLAVPIESPLPACDAEVPMLSLAHRLDVRERDIEDGPYLRSDASLRAKALERITRAGNARRKVGLVWAGAPHHGNDRRRSIPLDALSALFELPDVDWLSLQKGPRAEDIEKSAAAKRMLRLDPLTPLSETAALIDALDAVVAVDTSIAHMAGALGKPLLLMLPFAPDWRWGLEGERTRWYATARLFRQRTVGDWAPVVADVVRALREG
ncbi:MAG TPA: DUF5672 family protein [Casimicrobiaceae bacterium]|nr:DUF5672 family protein [Casimicrobiaceae bacterium]